MQVMVTTLKHILRGFVCILVFSTNTYAQQQTPEEESTINSGGCISTHEIQEYQVESDQIVHFFMRGSVDIVVRFKRHCPQLKFHKYISFTPVNNRLCAKFDDIVTRAGMHCRIDSISAVPKKEPKSY